MLRGLNKQNDDMSLENIFNWIWTSNIFMVMGAVVLVAIVLFVCFFFFFGTDLNSIEKFIVLALIALILFSYYS